MCAGHGTNVDGVWIRANEPRLLKKGATFKIAASSREYKVWLLTGAYKTQMKSTHKFVLKFTCWNGCHMVDAICAGTSGTQGQQDVKLKDGAACLHCLSLQLVK